MARKDRGKAEKDTCSMNVTDDSSNASLVGCRPCRVDHKSMNVDSIYKSMFVRSDNLYMWVYIKM